MPAPIDLYTLNCSYISKICMIVHSSIIVMLIGAVLLQKTENVNRYNFGMAVASKILLKITIRFATQKEMLYI